MIRVTACNSIGHGLKYFSTGLSHEDHYLTSRGHWFGEGAVKLNLPELATRQDFAALCRNIKPGTDTPLTARTKANRRVGWDIGFSVPKSVSLLFALGSDTGILVAYHRAVMDTMACIERDAQTRVRRDGAMSDRTTGNLVWAQFTHTTARPVAGVPDPQLHSHCFLFNATHDAVDGIWKAVQIGNIRRDLPYYEALFLSRLAEEMHAIGYETRAKGKFWEIDGVPEEVVKQFSRRGQKVEDYATRNGIDNPALIAEIAARSRESKRRDQSEEDLRREWTERVKDEHKGFWDRVRGMFRDRRSAADLRQAVELVIGRTFEYEAVVLERKLIADVLTTAHGRYAEQDIRDECGRQGIIVRKKDGHPSYVTTIGVLQEEQKMVELARNARGRVAPLANRPFTEKETGLKGDQLAALNRLLASKDGVTLLDRREASMAVGVLPKLRELVEQNNLRPGILPFIGLPSMSVLAPSRNTAKEVLRSRTFKDAVTVSEFLGVGKQQFKAAVSGIVFVEDAGKLGTKQVRELLSTCGAMGTRVFLSGDTRQHRSASRGDCLRVLREHAKIQPAAVQAIQRQSGRFKEALEDLAAGRMATGFDRLAAMSAVKPCKPEKVAETAAADYVQSRKAGRSTLVITPRREEGAEVTQEIRKGMRKQGWLKKERTFPQLKRVEASTFERSRAEFYKRGQTVQFNQNAIGFRAGSRWKVVGRDPFRNVVVRSGLTFKALPLSKPERFSVFESSTIRIAVGDDIRITNNGRAFSIGEAVLNNALSRTKHPRHDLNNGSVHRVKRFTKDGGLHLESGLVVPKDFGHVDHGYCWTSVKAQGKEADKVILVQTKRTGRATSQEQFYSSVSCGREDIAVYTDDAAKLKTAVCRSSKGPSAMDIDQPQRPGDDTRTGTERARAEERRRNTEHSRERRGPEMERV
ncbi:MAG: MobF family relaxase [Planctomycetota bacterium]